MYRSRFALPLAMAALSAILLPSTLTAQITFQRTYGGTRWDQGCSVQMTRDGGYIVAGATLTFGAGYTDVYLVKTDVAGNVLWTKTYGGPNYEYSFSVQQAADGGYIIAGYTESFGAGQEDIYLVRTDSNGDTLWTKTFGGAHYDEGLSVLLTTAYLDEAERCGHVVLLHQGKVLAQGAPAEVTRMAAGMSYIAQPAQPGGTRG